MSNTSAGSRYKPTDRMSLWLLTDPAHPVLIGEINWVRATRGVSLRYAQEWIARGFALSEDLPLGPGEFFPKEPEYWFD